MRALRAKAEESRGGVMVIANVADAMVVIDERTRERDAARTEIAACHALLDERGTAIGAEASY